MSNPYLATIQNLRTRLVDAAGPFAAAESVKYWVEEAEDAIAPSERLVSALRRAQPCALLSYSRGSPGENVGGGDQFSHRATYTVRFAVRGPSGDMVKAIEGAAAPHWGVLEVVHWIVRRCCQYQVAGTHDGIEYAGDFPVAMADEGVIAHAVQLSAQYVITTGD